MGLHWVANGARLVEADYSIQDATMQAMDLVEAQEDVGEVPFVWYMCYKHVSHSVQEGATSKVCGLRLEGQRPLW